MPQPQPYVELEAFGRMKAIEGDGDENVTVRLLVEGREIMLVVPKEKAEDCAKALSQPLRVTLTLRPV